ncbi:restriction endonuclease subunit S [Providencia stuartii]|uniref:restriction endonuclease subunit S n=1 Tax=Providencia stuartii TaxID=588 RepID=UPI0025AACC21|nr:restriction endonuclease subunit S [Providencia stuartii]MDN0020293.1 restriction endonuclease subunit S [Providencia stuartii]
MSHLNYLEKLLDGVDVEWTTLGNEHAVEIANSGRKPVKAALRVAGETPYYGANNIQDYVDGYTHAGEFVLIAEDGSASVENYSIQYATGRFWANNHVHVVRGKEGLNTRYLYHYLCIVNFVPFLSGGGRAKLTKGKLVDIPLPIPCPDNPEKSLAIQSEIVRILDKFTALTAELTAELNMRKKQYNYYRDQLLSFEEGEVEWKTLGWVGEVRMCKRIMKNETSDIGDIPFFKIGTPNDPKKSLAEQSRVVAILDKFDALTNSITEGLPREIDLRQKQYEYYRDLLLNFPKSHSNEVA